MQLYHFDNAEQYYERVKKYLLQNEAEHCLIFGTLNNLIHFPKFSTAPPYLVTAEEDGILAVAVRTPLHKLILSRSLNSDAIKALAQDLYFRSQPLPGLIAPNVEATTFVQAWQALTGQTYKISMALRIHQLETVQPIPKASGYLRQASKCERNLLISWCQAFTKEALGRTIERDNRSLIDRHLSEVSLYIWQDNFPVSMAGFSGATPNGIRINLVYTPPEYRRKGYATSCVATLSQTLLNEGRKYCFLFTDLANSTSNHIYRTIGYQPVCDLNDYWFEDSM